MPNIAGQENNEQPIDILLAEDNEADVKITLRAFKKSEIQNNVFVVNDGQETIDYICGHGTYHDRDKHPFPSLILLDINMPKMDGIEVLRKLKGDDRYKHIPIIMLTSSRNEEDVAKSYSSGAASYIPKPVSYEDFQKVIDTFNFYWHVINKLPTTEQ